MVSTPTLAVVLQYRSGTRRYLHLQAIEVRLHFRPGKIYSEEEIDKAKHSPSFDREYRCQFLGLFVGNVFSSLQIDKAIELGEKYKSLAY